MDASIVGESLGVYYLLLEGIDEGNIDGFSDRLPLFTIVSDSEIITVGGTVGVAVDTVEGSTLSTADWLRRFLNTWLIRWYRLR